MATTAAVLLLPNFLSSPSPPTPAFPGLTLLPHGSPPPSPWPQQPRVRARAAPAAITCCATPGSSGGSGNGKIQSRRATVMPEPQLDSAAVDCIGTGTGTGTGTDVECFFAESTSESDGLLQPGKASSFEVEGGGDGAGSDGVLARGVFEWALLVSPFFFWGTAMVAMKGVIPKAGPFFVSAFRLVPAGLMLIGFAGIRGRKQPSGAAAWLSIIVFGIVDAACFQGFLAEGLQKTSAGLGSVIIDSQPLTVSILAALLFGESIGVVGAAGLVLGVVGLLLLEVPALEESSSSIWGSGEWWMLLAAQSMAVGTVMVRWVSKYSDPVMATGWLINNYRVPTEDEDKRIWRWASKGQFCVKSFARRFDDLGESLVEIYCVVQAIIVEDPGFLMEDCCEKAAYS